MSTVARQRYLRAPGSVAAYRRGANRLVSTVDRVGDDDGISRSGGTACCSGNRLRRGIGARILIGNRDGRPCRRAVDGQGQRFRNILNAVKAFKSDLNGDGLPDLEESKAAGL